MSKPLKPEDLIAANVEAKEFLDMVVRFVEDERERGCTDPDPLIAVRALIAARRTLDVLARNGFPRFLPIVHELQRGCERLRRLACREIVRRLLLDTIPEPKASECLSVLSGLVESGHWPDWKKDWDVWEDEVCAKLAAEKAAPLT